MKEMKNSPSINQASKKMAKRGVDKMMEWEKKRQAKLEKLKQEKIEREKSHVILPKASKKSEKILLKKKRQLKKQKRKGKINAPTRKNTANASCNRGRRK